METLKLGVLTWVPREKWMRKSRLLGQECTAWGCVEAETGDRGDRYGEQAGEQSEQQGECTGASHCSERVSEM